MAITTSGTSITFNDGTVQTTAGGPAYLKGFANFNGGTATVRRGFNTSSVTRNQAGVYTVNWTTAIGSTDYIVSTCSQTVSGGGQAQVGMMLCYTSLTATPIQSASCQLSTATNGFSVNDCPICCVSANSN